MDITLYTLLVSTGMGFVWLLVIFTLCFCVVHGIRLAKYGIPKKPTQPPVPQEKSSAPSEPIYYIVEKKRARQKAKYGEPKEIRFQ